jgi:CHAT domain-containing protein/tetratricopeptide (TPR) repeat protein
MLLTSRRLATSEVLFSTLLLCLCFFPVQGSPTDSDAKKAMARGDELCTNWNERSFREATEQYDKATQTSKSTSDFVSASNSALKAGDVLYLLSEYEESSKRYQNALALARRAGDWLSQARALSQMGRLQCYLGNNDLAEKQLTTALQLFRQHDTHDSAYGEALSNLAEVNYAKGDFLKASKELENALQYLQDDRNAQAKVHLFMGYLAGSIGETEKAVSEILQAQDLYRALHDKSGEASTLTALGISHSRKGDHNRAIDLHLEAIEIFRAIGDRHSEAITLNALGEAHQILSEYSIAINKYEEALKLHQAIGSVDGAAVSAFQIATAYDGIGQPDQAIKYHELCLKLSRAAGKIRTEANALNEIAKIYARQGRREIALQQYQKIRAFYVRIGDLRGQVMALNAHGDFLMQSKPTREALAVYRQALAFAEKVEEQDLLIATLYNLARANVELGSPEAALPFVKRSLKIVEDLRANVESPDFRASYFSGVQKHYELGIEILMQLEGLHPKQGFAADALILSERGRARLLSDLLAESQVSLQIGVTDELLDRERRLRGLLRSQAGYRMDLSLNKRDPAELTEVDNELVQLRAEYQQVQAELNRRRARPAAPDQTPLDVSRIQSELRDSDTMLLEYSLGEEVSYLWVVTANSLQACELPSRKIIEDAAIECYQLMTARPETEGQGSEYQSKVNSADQLLAEKASRLSEMLLGPVANQLGSRRLLVVPDGALQYIPFDALPLPHAHQFFLLQDHEVVVLPSIQTLIALRSTANHLRSHRKLVAVFADPVFDDSDDRVQKQTSGTEVARNDRQSVTRGGALGRLAHASEEADAITAAAPWGTTMVAKGFDASRETIMSSDIGQYQILHFATHASVDHEHPEMSGIVLAMLDRNGAKTNGMMPLEDIYNLDLSAQLTVLSACQTALGKELKGEGVVGLTHAFMSAGSKSVVASVWNIDDRATAFLMEDFYESMLQKGMTPAAALRASKLRMMHDKRWSAPYYWAGFILQGEYRDQIVVDHRTPTRFVALALLLILISSSFFIWRKWKRGHC